MWIISDLLFGALWIEVEITPMAKTLSDNVCYDMYLQEPRYNIRKVAFMLYHHKYNLNGENIDTYFEFNKLNEKRIKLLDIQNRVKAPILFCTCNNEEIAMLLTKHEPTPHFQTKHIEDKSKHYKFCHHHINTNLNVQYKPAITIDEDGDEIAHIDFKRNDDEIRGKINDTEYIAVNEFKHTGRNSIVQGKMSFPAFVKYKNMQYFKINQFTHRTFDIAEFNRLLYGFINQSKIGKGKTLEELKSKGKFFYSMVFSIRDADHGKKVIHADNKSHYYISLKEFNQANEQFANTYNGLRLNELLDRNDLKVVFFGFKNTNKYSTCDNCSFILVNKYGLYCESLKEVEMYNMVCNHLFCSNHNGYYFYKPLAPENDYANPNYIADGVIRKIGTAWKYIIEVFGRKEPEYLERKDEKLKTCKHKLVAWDIYNSLSFEECLREIQLIK